MLSRDIFRVTMFPSQNKGGKKRKEKKRIVKAGPEQESNILESDAHLPLPL